MILCQIRTKIITATESFQVIYFGSYNTQHTLLIILKLLHLKDPRTYMYISMQIYNLTSMTVNLYTFIYCISRQIPLRVVHFSAFIVQGKPLLRRWIVANLWKPQVGKADFHGRYSCNPVMFLFIDMATDQETGPSGAAAKKLVGGQSLETTGSGIHQPLNATCVILPVFGQNSVVWWQDWQMNRQEQWRNRCLWWRCLVWFSWSSLPIICIAQTAIPDGPGLDGSVTSYDNELDSLPNDIVSIIESFESSAPSISSALPPCITSSTPKHLHHLPVTHPCQPLYHSPAYHAIPPPPPSAYSAPPTTPPRVPHNTPHKSCQYQHQYPHQSVTTCSQPHPQET